jgi:hypothetical protein
LQTNLRSAAYAAVTACLLESVGLGHGIVRTSSDKGKVNLVTRSHFDPRWNNVHSLLYVNGVKVVPSNVEQYTTAFGLALAIMGDGRSRSRNTSLSICLNNYSEAEIRLIADALLNLYGIKCSIHGGKYPDLYFSTGSMPTVRKLVKPYLHSSWYYKINA